MTTLQLPSPVAPVTRRRLVLAPRLSVVIVNFRQWKNTNKLVRQIRATAAARRGEIEVVIVDNHSPPHRLMHRLRRRRGVSVRRWGRNRGFARAVNEGSRLSQSEWVLVLNPDVRVTVPFLDGVLNLAKNMADDDPRAGIIGFGLRNADGSPQGSSGPFPTFWNTLTGLLLPRAQRKYEMQPTERRAVSWVTGCCLLFRRECFRDIGGLSDDFFLYYEDVDFCRRAQEFGWSVLVEPNLTAVHLNPLHGRDVAPHLRMATRHALLTYARRYWSSWQFRILGNWVRFETRIRRFWATWKNARASAKVFRELEKMTAEMLRGGVKQARRRLARVMNRPFTS